MTLHKNNACFMLALLVCRYYTTPSLMYYVVPWYRKEQETITCKMYLAAYAGQVRGATTTSGKKQIWQQFEKKEVENDVIRKINQNCHNAVYKWSQLMSCEVLTPSSTPEHTNKKVLSTPWLYYTYLKYQKQIGESSRTGILYLNVVK